LFQDLFIIAHPIGLLPFDESRQKILKRALKRRVVDQVDLAFEFTIQSLLQELVPLLTHTIQLHVRNVHVRYEDPRCNIAVGVFIQEFSVETTNR